VNSAGGGATPSSPPSEAASGLPSTSPDPADSEAVGPGAFEFPRRWHARWIWDALPDIGLTKSLAPTLDQAAAARTVLFRRTFDLADVPKHVPARLAADSRYILWVNGEEVSRGPIRGNPRRLHYDTVDLAPHLVTGANTLAVCARRYGAATAWWMPAPVSYGLGGGSFLFEARIDPQENLWLVSSESWRCLPSDAFDLSQSLGISALPIEQVDARRLPHGWELPGFDDGSWEPAVELRANHVGFNGEHRPPTHPYGPMVPRPIPQLAGTRRDARVAAAGVAPTSESAPDPVQQVRADFANCSGIAKVKQGKLPFKVELGTSYDAGMLVLDFGEQVAGTVLIEISSPEGVQIDAQAAEGISADGAPDPQQQHAGFRYITRGHHDLFETFDPMGLRYLALSFRGTGAISLQRVSVQERLSPRPEGPSFECSDPMLNRIWARGRRTVDLCSHDAYLDCPSREQRAWTGDAVVHQMVDLTTNTDWSLARWNTELGASPRPDGMLPMAAGGDFEHRDEDFIPDWSLHWIHGLHNLGMYTGDRELISRLLPVAENVLRWFLPFRDVDGLLTDVTGWVIIDWSAVPTAGASAALNALWGRALREFKQLAELVGDSGRAEWAGALWVDLRKAFQLFWDPERSVYVDQLLDGIPQRSVSQHANATAIVARLTRGVDIEQLLDTIVDPDRLVYASWLLPGRHALLENSDDPGDMYADASTLVSGPAEPWWDLERGVVAAQPFYRYIVHDAAAVADRADMIPGLCRDWRRLAGRSATTFSETWFGGSHCHAWSATPTRDLMQYTLGVTPAAPGFTRARVAPVLGDLAWARGAVPTPAGLLTVDARPDRVVLDTPVEANVVFGGIDTRVGPGQHELTTF